MKEGKIPLIMEELPQILHGFGKQVKLLRKHILKGGPEYIKKLSCGSSLIKSELAQLFFILMEEKIFVLDEFDPVKNRAKLQVFLQKNFTYRGDGGLQTKIKTVSREFSEAKGFVYRQKQILFLEKLIVILQERKNKLQKFK